MDFLTLAKERYSARSFSNQSVAPELVGKILEAGRLAPTAGNFQPQRILVLDNKGNLEKLSSLNKRAHMFHTPLCFVVCYDNSESAKRTFDNHDYGITDGNV